MEQLDEASRRINEIFLAASLPDELVDALVAAHDEMGRPPVAVRSSATAEDLAELSFAGQQETYLNVQGSLALRDAVVRCWSSLWTARAIGYRARNGFPQDGISMAVVVQRMVESHASGVLFTANPVTGLRTETVIDATLGLGEALVSGLVEPDHYEVETATGRIRAVRLGSKAIEIRSAPGGGTVSVGVEAARAQALPTDRIQELTRLGQQVANLYGAPQDIEWAWDGNRLWLLQTRPITSLYPLPRGMPAEPLSVLFSFAAVQGMSDPITPLGQDYIRQIFAAGAGLLGLRKTRQTQTALLSSGERLWANITTPLKYRLGRGALRVALSMVEPTILQALLSVWDDPRLVAQRRRMYLRTARHLVRFMVPVARNMLLNLIAPHARRRLIVGEGERLLELIRKRCASLPREPRARLARLALLLPELAAERLPRTLVRFVSVMAAAMVSFTVVRRLSGVSSREGQDLSLEITRGLPHNPTTEMDLELWQVARSLREGSADGRLTGADAATLESLYVRGALPQPAQRLMARFLERYGCRGLAEFDAGRTRWIEDPLPVFEMLRGYLTVNDKDQAPDALFAAGARRAEQVIGQLAAAARRGRGGRRRARLLRLAAGRTRALMGARENPKFFAVRMMGTLRLEIMEVGRTLWRAGELEQADDLVYLTIDEMVAFASDAPRDWKGLIRDRRALYAREMLRRQVPRLLLSDGRAFYEGLNRPMGSSGTFAGSPVSPGRAEGVARIVRDPRRAGLLPGEIMVCPGTDPSWTPLFLIASALVMETGGMMTHGAVVAREYGIPAVVGVDRATERLRTGQRLRVDGSRGTVEVLEP